jgi:hypothetical protein
MALGKKTGGREKGTLNIATREVRELASEYGPAALEELARLGNEAVNETARISAIALILKRAYGDSSSVPIHIELPDTSTPAGVIGAMAAIVAAVSRGDISPAEASDLTRIVDAQRRAIELGDHEARLQKLEATEGART